MNNTTNQELLESLRNMTPHGQLPGPSIAYLSFIPEQQRSNILTMTADPPITLEMKMPTAFIGTIRSNYNNEMWKTDVANWKSYFEKRGLQQDYWEIALLSLNENMNILNSSDAIPKIEALLNHINGLPTGEKIRVICLGTGYTAFLYQAISYLLQEWSEPNGIRREQKLMQFITSGDSENRDLNHFCQWLCISGACQGISFYNTMTYHPFGYCSSQYQGIRYN